VKVQSAATSVVVFLICGVVGAFAAGFNTGTITSHLVSGLRWVVYLGAAVGVVTLAQACFNLGRTASPSANASDELVVPIGFALLIVAFISFSFAR
jgi:hypothetical protein